MRREKKKMMVSVLSLALAAGLVPVVPVEAVKKPTMPKTLSVKVKKKKTLKVKSTKKKVAWKILSGKKCIATKKSGKYALIITGKKKGTAKVQAAIGKTKLKCKVTVNSATAKNPSSSNSVSGKTNAPSKTGTPPGSETGDPRLRICNGVLCRVDEEAAGEIVIPDNVTRIGERAFQYCSKVTKVTIPSSVTSIGREAFNGGGVTSLVIPDSVTDIEEWAFYGCSGLTSVKISKNITSLGDFVFSGCAKLTGVEIPDGVKSIGDCAFDGCAALASVKMPTGVTSIDKLAFRNTPWLEGKKQAEDFVIAGNVLVSYGKINAGAAVIPNEITSIAGGAFSECENLTGVKLPDGIKDIGDEAFSGCKGLTSVNLPNGLTSIGDGAFSGCKGLTGVDIPDSVTNMGREMFDARGVFSGCSGLTSVKLPNGLTRIGEGAFSGCKGLTSVDIPDSVTSIGLRAFSNCSKLEKITIPKSVSCIEGFAFLDTPWLEKQKESSKSSGFLIVNNILLWCSKQTSTELKIPDGVTRIADSIVDVWDSVVTDLIIPSSVKVIDDGAFYGYSKLERVTAKGNFERINYGAFYETPWLRNQRETEDFVILGGVLLSGGKVSGNAVIPDGVTRIGYRAFFYSNKKITNLTIPESVTVIEDEAFMGCAALTSVKMPKSIKSIGVRAFDQTGLISLAIPGNGVSIGEEAFRSCCDEKTGAWLDSVTIPGDAVVDRRVFPEGCKINYHD